MLSWDVPASGTIRLGVSLTIRQEQEGHARPVDVYMRKGEAGINSYRLLLQTVEVQRKPKPRAAVVFELDN